MIKLIWVRGWEGRVVICNCSVHRALIPLSFKPIDITNFEGMLLAVLQIFSLYYPPNFVFIRDNLGLVPLFPCANSIAFLHRTGPSCLATEGQSRVADLV